MQKAFKDIVERLDKASDYYECDEQGREHVQMLELSDAIEIVNQVAEEYEGVTTCYLKSICEYQNEDIRVDDSIGWIPCSEQLPPHSDDLLLIQCSGKPRKNIEFKDAFCLASYTEVGWILELYPDWEDADVVAWKPLGEPYQPKGE